MYIKETFTDFFSRLYYHFEQTSHLEWIAFICGVLQVVLAWKKLVLNFYFGLISVFFYTIVFYNAGLYAESLLNAYYFIISILGIFLWKQKSKSAILFCNKKEHLTTLFLFLLALLFQYLILKFYTSSDVPFLDAMVAALAWSGSWLLIHKKVENWLWLNLSNVIAIPLQWYKGLELTALLTLIYFVVAVFGYYHWKKEASLRN